MPAKFLRNGDAFRDVARASAESGKKLNSESCECDQNDHVSSSQSQNTKKEVERGAARWRGRPGRGEDLGRGRDKNDRGAAVVGHDPSELGGARKGERNPKVIVEIERDCCSAVITGGFFCFLASADFFGDLGTSAFLDEETLLTGAVSQRWLHQEHQQRHS